MIVVTSSAKPERNTIKSDALLVKVTKDELLRESDMVVMGTVQNIESFKGASEIRPGKEDIYSNVTLRVDDYLYSPKPLFETNITVRALGGSFGGTTMTVTDGPAFDKDQRVIVFLKQHQESVTNKDGQAVTQIYYTVVGWAQGKYTIENGVVGKGNERMFVRDIFGQDTMTVTEFRNKINTP